MDQLSHLHWKETSKNTYERSLDDAELFYTIMAKAWEGTGYTYFAITAAVSITVPLGKDTSFETAESKLISCLKYAWKRLRVEQPTLVAQVQFDPATGKCKKVYKVLESEAELDEWVDRTFKVLDGVVSGLDFANTDPEFGNHAALWITSPSSTEDSQREGFLSKDLVFRCGHDIIDGIGTLKLFSIILGYVAEAYASNSPADISRLFITGTEYQKLSPPLQLAAKMPETPTTEQISKLKALHESNAKARGEESEVFGVPISLKTHMPKRSQRSVLALSASETSKIVAKCKAYGVTPTHLFHTAVALSVRDLQKPSATREHGRYITYALIDLRRECEGSDGKEDLHPASVRHTVSVKHMVVDLTLPQAPSSTSSEEKKKELLTALGKVRDFYREVTILDKDFLDTVPTVYKSVTPPYPESIPEVPAPKSKPAVSLSSFGVVDKLIRTDYGEIKVRDPWVIGAEYSSGLGCFLGTFGGRMEVSAGWNEAFYEKAEVMGFLERVKGVVDELLDVMV